MQFIRTIQREEATGELNELYERAAAGQFQAVPIVKAWSLRPDVLSAATALGGAIRSHMDERRYELVTVVAAAAVRCSVCTLQHGALLLKTNSFTPEQVEALASDHRAAGLGPVDEAIAEFAQRVVLESDRITQADVEALRSAGLEDPEIFDVILAATYRGFWSRTNDAIGYEPSRGWLEQTPAFLGERLWQALSVGRQFETTA